MGGSEAGRTAEQQGDPVHAAVEFKHLQRRLWLRPFSLEPVTIFTPEFNLPPLDKLLFECDVIVEGDDSITWYYKFGKGRVHGRSTAQLSNVLEVGCQSRTKSAGDPLSFVLAKGCYRHLQL